MKNAKLSNQEEELSVSSGEFYSELKVDDQYDET